LDTLHITTGIEPILQFRPLEKKAKEICVITQEVDRVYFALCLIKSASHHEDLGEVKLELHIHSELRQCMEISGHLHVSAFLLQGKRPPGMQNWSGRCSVGEKNVLSLPEIETRNLGHSVRSLLLY
jgi:hypothetical protein